jgi:hypothetical protein
MTSMTVSDSDDMLALARTLPIPVPWDRDVFIQNLARQRGRPIRLIATSPLIEGPCGLLLARHDDDVIIHAAGTSEYHKDHIVCHEVAHMVLGHVSGDQRIDTTGASALWRNMLPDIDPATVQAVLGRKTFVDEQEQEAERFAHILMFAAAEAAAEKSTIRSVFFRS